MYLLYLDESGSVKDASQQYFVLAGVALFERQTHWLAEKLENIAARIDPVAYAVFRAFERRDTQFYDIIKGRFDAEGGVVHGLYHR